jgi:GAG-pre-integrase domain
MIKNSQDQTITTIPHSDGLYKIVATKQSNANETANTASGKMSISEVHRKLGHISCYAIKQAIANDLITGIDLDISFKPEFCKACTKAKSACQPFPKESDTRAEKFRECKHWDL